MLEQASGGPAAKFSQSFHGFATRIQGFATKRNALAQEIPLATQAKRFGKFVFFFKPCGYYSKTPERRTLAIGAPYLGKFDEPDEKKNGCHITVHTSVRKPKT